MVFLLLVAGYETTANLLSNGTLALLLHPAELAKLKADPSLIKPAIEEFLRFDGPVETSTQRFAREDIEYGGQLIRKGEEVRVVIAGADRDPAHLAHHRPQEHAIAAGHVFAPNVEEGRERGREAATRRRAKAFTEIWDRIASRRDGHHPAIFRS